MYQIVLYSFLLKLNFYQARVLINFNWISLAKHTEMCLRNEYILYLGDTGVKQSAASEDEEDGLFSKE